jgi:hypothetical protein
MGRGLPVIRAALLVLVPFACACGLFKHKQQPPPAPSPPPRAARQDPLPVRPASEEVVVAAWSEPARLPPAGGQAQILVRAQKRNGDPFPGVEVRLRASAGALFSGGRTLVTDSGGRTRDRLTTRQTSLITLNAGGTVYRFTVHLTGE